MRGAASGVPAGLLNTELNAVLRKGKVLASPSEFANGALEFGAIGALLGGTTHTYKPPFEPPTVTREMIEAMLRSAKAHP